MTDTTISYSDRLKMVYAHALKTTISVMRQAEAAPSYYNTGLRCEVIGNMIAEIREAERGSLPQISLDDVQLQLRNLIGDRSYTRHGFFSGMQAAFELFEEQHRAKDLLEGRAKFVFFLILAHTHFLEAGDGARE